MREKLFIGDDFNGYVGICRNRFDSVHENFGFGERNEAV